MTNEVIKFGTDGWRAIIGQAFTVDNVNRVAAGTVAWLKTQSSTSSAVIGYDCRFNGVMFARAVASYFAGQGIKVFLSPGFVSTPMVSLATLQRQANCGIIITASHNPPEYSGYKVKGNFGGPAFPNSITEIEQAIPPHADSMLERFEDFVEKKMIEYFDMEALYLNHIRMQFDLPLIQKSGIRVGYDAMFGAGQRVMKKILPQATFLHCDYNPSFEGQAPEPIDKNLQPFKQLILSQNLQFGLATDGDADRIGLYDEKGEFVDSHHILLLLVHYLAGIKQQKGKVVYTFSCTNKIAELAKYYHLPYEVTKIGFKYISEIIAKERVIVGGEESGGIAVDGHIPERDGIYIGLTILELMAKTGKSLSSLCEDIYGLVGRFSVQREDLHLSEVQKQAVIQACHAGSFQTFGSYKVVRTETVDGFKYHFGDGQWVMIRPSGTEPVLRIYAEGADKAAAKAILAQTVAAVNAR